MGTEHLWEKLRVQERRHFGLHTDMYFASSRRDNEMEADTRRRVQAFLIRVSAGACAVEWEKPSDAAIKALLTEG